MKLYYFDIKQPLKPATQLMLRACTATSIEQQREYVEGWDKIVDINEIEYSVLRLVPLFYYKNQQAGITTQHDKRLQVVYKYWWLKTQHIGNQLKALHGAFVAAGIQPIVIKGASLMSYYPKPELRPMADFDLIVSPRDIEKAVLVLKSAGYAPAGLNHHMLASHKQLALSFQHAMHWVHTATDTNFDLHWKVGSHCSQHLTQQLLSTLTPFSGLPGGKRPALEYEVFLIIIHAVASWQEDNLTWMIDIDVLNRQFDKSFWQKARAIAVQEKKEDMFDYGCYILQQNGIYAPPVKNKLVRIPYVVANKKPGSRTPLSWFAYRLSDNLLIAHYLFPHLNRPAKFIQACRRIRYKYFFRKLEKKSGAVQAPAQ